MEHCLPIRRIDASAPPFVDLPTRNTAASAVERTGIVRRLALTAALFVLAVVHILLTVSAWIVDPGLEFTDLDAGAVAVALACMVLSVAAVRRPTLHGRILLIGYSTLLALAAGEGALMLLQVSASPVNGPWTRMHRVMQVESSLPGIGGRVEFTTNSLGLRGPEVDLDEVDTRILCVGGSTTECLYVTDDETWPTLLGAGLSKRTGTNVFVGNAGKSGHWTGHHRHLLEHYEPADRFDCVVVLCGINDLGRLLRDDYEECRKRVPEETLAGGKTIGPYYRRLAIVRKTREFLRAFRRDRAVQDPSGKWQDRQAQKRAQILAANTIDSAPGKLNSAVERYAEDLKSIIDVGRRRDLKLVFVTQPTLWRADLPKRLEIQLVQHTDDGAHSVRVLSEAMDAFNQTMRDVCRKERVDCCDLAARLPHDDGVFYDGCHFNVRGCRLVAEELALFLNREQIADRR